MDILMEMLLEGFMIYDNGKKVESFFKKDIEQGNTNLFDLLMKTGRLKVKHRMLVNYKTGEDRRWMMTLTDNTNEPSAAADLIKAQREQMEHISTIEWLKQIEVKIENDILLRTKPSDVFNIQHK